MRHIHHGECRNLQSPFRTTRAAVEEVTQPERLFPALRNEGGILRREHFCLRVERRGDDSLVKVRPVESASKLSGDGAFRVVAVTAQMANVDVAPQRKDGAEQHDKELALRLTHRRHLLEDIVDNGHGHAPGNVLSTHIQPAYGHFFHPVR